MRFWRKKKQDEDVADQQDDALVSDAEIEAELAQYAEEPTPEELAVEQAEVREQTTRAVERTKRGFFGRLTGIFDRADFDDSIWDELEEVLIASDAGLATTEALLDGLRANAPAMKASSSSQLVRAALREELIAVLESPAKGPPAWAAAQMPSPLIILVVGVNGAGKTTTIAKMSSAFQADGAIVILGAADTFRAAASTSFKVWGERVGVRVIAHQPTAL